VVYTASTHTTGGRDGTGRSSDGALDVKLSSPGSGKPGTNPEQLFAVGWSACFMGAMGLAAKRRKFPLPADTSVDAEVDLATGRRGLRPAGPPQGARARASIANSSPRSRRRPTRPARTRRPRAGTSTSRST
jgi:organic hydroperoxide reductase OsmC/OhrA